MRTYAKEVSVAATLLSKEGIKGWSSFFKKTRLEREGEKWLKLNSPSIHFAFGDSDCEILFRVRVRSLLASITKGSTHNAASASGYTEIISLKIIVQRMRS